MAVKFLSGEWVQAINDALGSSEDFKKAAAGKNVKLQQVVTDVPNSGEVKYYFQLENGRPELALGELMDAEATLTQNYETATAISKQQLNPQSAFMQGKLKVSGNMMKLLQLQSVFNAVPQAVRDVDVEY